MRITVLCENTTNRTQLLAEHGLSLYIETEKHNILFDMGQTDAYLHNAKKLGIDLSGVDIGILSHGHYDHGGGLQSFLNINEKAFVYVNENVFDEYYNGSQKYIGLCKELKNHPRLKMVSDFLKIDDELSLHSCNERDKIFPVNSYGLRVKKNGEIHPDTFLHEQYLLIQEGNRQILISGCSHKGVQNIVDWFLPDVLVGGFHFTKLDPKTEDRCFLIEASNWLLKQPTKYYTGHCTGVEQFAFIKDIMGNQIEAISTGDTIVI